MVGVLLLVLVVVVTGVKQNQVLRLKHGVWQYYIMLNCKGFSFRMILSVSPLALIVTKTSLIKLKIPVLFLARASMQMWRRELLRIFMHPSISNLSWTNIKNISQDSWKIKVDKKISLGWFQLCHSQLKCYCQNLYSLTSTIVCLIKDKDNCHLLNY